jgi:hypothetical protein
MLVAEGGVGITIEAKVKKYLGCMSVSPNALRPHSLLHEAAWVHPIRRCSLGLFTGLPLPARIINQPSGCVERLFSVVPCRLF